MSMIVGIDPGFTGGVSFLEPGSWGLDVYDMPTYPNPKGKTELDLRGLAALLTPRDPSRNIAVLEKVASRPGQSAPATFRFGQGYGAIEMALAAHGYEIHYVTPAKWKQHFGLSKDKGVSRSMATHRFPAQADSFKRVKDDGRAESSLLALYGFEKLFIDQMRTA